MRKRIGLGLVLIMMTLLSGCMFAYDGPQLGDLVEEIEGLRVHYTFTQIEEDNIVKDASGNGYDGVVYGRENMIENQDDEAIFFSNGAYVQIPTEAFAGEETLTVSVWLKNYSGKANTAAMFIGAKKNMPVNYWLLNPSNPAGKLKSVFTDKDNASAPYNTEIGISPSVAVQGIEGPDTDTTWHHYVTVITPEELTVYMDGELVGTVEHIKKLTDFGEEIVAYIGKSSYVADPTFSGFVSDVRIYNRKLTKEEINMLYEFDEPNSAYPSGATRSEIFIADRADPYVTRGSDGYFYFTASYPMYGANDKDGYDRIILRRAETLEGLATAEEIVIWDEKDSSIAHRFIWAPEIHEINGKWYVFFAASGSSNNVWDINCHVIACDGKDPYTDKWTDKGKFQAAEGDSVSFTDFSLDMTYFECNGVHYVSWAQKVGESKVYLATIDPEEPWKATSKAMLLTQPEYYWERVNIPVNEGPATMIHDGRIYLAFSASATGPEYCMGLMYADVKSDLMDPNAWTKLETPLLTSDDLFEEYGPGHNCFVQDEYGNWCVVYHSRSEKCYKGECGYGNGDPLYDPCRSAHVRMIRWGEDGLPILNQ